MQGIWLPLITLFLDDKLDEGSRHRLIRHYAAQPPVGSAVITDEDALFYTADARMDGDILASPHINPAVFARDRSERRCCAAKTSGHRAGEALNTTPQRERPRTGWLCRTRRDR